MKALAVFKLLRVWAVILGFSVYALIYRSLMDAVIIFFVMMVFFLATEQLSVIKNEE